ncbi:MAG: hypothetical protein M1833_005091 [Piccolia ochrophora]|nr:MAG: hypothetical protein M1833_005091 [Piccolia ochrophora]
MSSHPSLTGVVVSAGLMMKTVKVRVARRVWDSHIRKHFTQPQHLLVHDPRASLLAGDVVTLSPGWPVSKQVHHVVTGIVAPFGPPVDARPPIPTEDERRKEHAEKRARKLERRELRREQGESSGAEVTKKPGEIASEGRRKAVRRFDKGLQMEADAAMKETEVGDAIRRKGAKNRYT